MDLPSPPLSNGERERTTGGYSAAAFLPAAFFFR